jgi:hypothetical protein
MSAKKLPPKLAPQKIQHEAQLAALEFQITIAKAIAGLTGLAFVGIKVPASSIAPRYEPARMMVWIAASFVNLVFSSVDDKYINTRKKLAIASKKIY